MMSLLPPHCYDPWSRACNLLKPILTLQLLAGCAWFPWSQQYPAEDPLINQLLLELPRASSRDPVHPPLGPDQRGFMPTDQNSPQRWPSPRLAINTIQGCLRSRGIPSETVQEADPSNYDRRFHVDANGQPVASTPMLIVLHETVVSEQDTLNLFRTPHNTDAAQVSYHMIIPEDGSRVRVVADENRAFGAGNSAFEDFTIRLKPGSPGSINNIALHLSFVTPPDGRGEAASHSGYSHRQYQSAAAQVLLWQARYRIPLNRLTTHKAVDQSKTRTDPRSFVWSKFLSAHSQLARFCGLQAYASIR